MTRLVRILYSSSPLFPVFGTLFFYIELRVVVYIVEPHRTGLSLTARTSALDGEVVYSDKS